MIVGSDDGSVFSGLDDGIGVCRANRHAESVRDQFRVDAYASQRVDYCGDRDFLRYHAVAGVLFRHRRVDAGASVAADRGAWPGRRRRGAHRSGTAATEEEKRMYAEVLENNCSLLLQLINDILDLSKIESGTLTFAEEEMELNILLEELASAMRTRIVAEEVVLNCVTLSAPCFVVAEKKRLSQVLINLLTNAIKFTTKGSIRLGYEIHGKMLYFYVADTGCGFPESQKQKVFERFVRLDSAKPGTGLGLAICRTIVEKMGGCIGVESEEGKGSCFWFTIPYIPLCIEKNDI